MKKLNQFKRISKIIERLKNGESFTIDEIANQYEISTRTAQRDFSEKIESQFPDEQLKRDPRTKKWSLSLKNSIFSKEDELLLNVLLEESKKYSDSFHSNISKFVKKYKHSLHSNTIYTKIFTENINEIKEQLVEIEEAIHSKNIIECIYKNETSKRKLAPLRLTNFDGYWYLLVKDLTPKKNKKIKTFYFKDITDISVKNEKYDNVDKTLQYKLDNAINSYFTGEVEPYPVQLFIEKEASVYFERKKISPSQRILKKDEKAGTIEIELYITNDMEIIPIIQSFLPYVKVISPIELENKIKQNIKNF